jgi:hypothetical protein
VEAESIVRIIRGTFSLGAHSIVNKIYVEEKLNEKKRKRYESDFKT